MVLIIDHQDFWRKKVEENFGLTQNKSNVTWQEKYEYLNKMDPNTLILLGATEDSLKCVEKALTNGANNYQLVAGLAAAHESVNVMNRMLAVMKDNKVKPKYNNILKYAAMAGKMAVIDMILKLMEKEKFTPNYNSLMAGAAQGKQMEIYRTFQKKMIERGILPNYRRIVTSAALGGNKDLIIEIFNLMAEDGITPKYNDLIISAIIGSYPDVIKMILSFMNEVDYDRILSAAFKYSSIEIVELLFETMHQDNQPINYDIVSNYVIASNSIENFKWMSIKMALDNVQMTHDEMLSKAAYYGSMEIISFILDEMSKENLTPDYNEMIMKATQSGKSEVVRKFLRYCKNIDYHEILMTSLDYKHPDIFQLTMTLKRSDMIIDFNFLLMTFISYRNEYAVTFLLKEMEQRNLQLDYERVISRARKTGYRKIIELCTSPLIMRIS